MCHPFGLSLIHIWEKKYAPKQPDEEWNPLFAEALYKKNYIEYLLDILLYGSLEERKALVAEQRKEVLKLEQRIAELSADRTCLLYTSRLLCAGLEAAGGTPPYRYVGQTAQDIFLSLIHI